MSIIYPTLQEQQVIDDIRGAIGRDVIFYKEYLTTCSGCTLDTLTGNSTNSFCPICSGSYYISTYSGVTLSGHVTWGNINDVTWPVGGEIFNGDCRTQIKYTLDNLDTVKSASYVEIDGIRLKIKDYILRGVQTINRIIILLKQKERD